MLCSFFDRIFRIDSNLLRGSAGQKVTAYLQVAYPVNPEKILLILSNSFFTCPAICKAI